MNVVRTTLGELVPVLRPILEDLMRSDLARAPFVIVNVDATRFVQFIREAGTGRLLIDSPPLGFYLVPVEEPDRGSLAAADWLTTHFKLASSTPLEIEVDGDPLN